MANHNLPTQSSTYTNFVTELDGRLDDLAVGLDPARTTMTNLPTNSVGWSSAGNKWQRWTGSAWADLATTYAISINGNAATATTLQTARTINGVSFNGSANINVPTQNSITFSNTGGAAVGTTFNGSTARTISFATVGAPSTTGSGASGTWGISITGSATNITGVAAISNGGTGASTAAAARTNLGLNIGTDVLAPNGNASNLTNINASSISTGVVPVARLGTGTPTIDTYLRGDGIWADTSDPVLQALTRYTRLPLDLNVGGGGAIWNTELTGLNVRNRLYTSIYATQTEYIPPSGKNPGYYYTYGSFIKNAQLSVSNLSTSKTLRINVVSGIYDGTDDTSRWVVYVGGSVSNSYTHSGGEVHYDSGWASRSGTFATPVLNTVTTSLDILPNSTILLTLYGGAGTGSGTDRVLPYLNVSFNSWV
jgi:hypothetical protein